MADLRITTQRIVLRQPELKDAAQLLKLFNQADFIDNIRDKNIRTIADAEQEVEQNISSHFERFGFSMMSMDVKEQSCIGMCGLIKRDELEVPDIGFAILSEYQNNGLVSEAATAIIRFGFNELKLKRIGAIVKPDNMASIRVITKLGLSFVKGIRLTPEDNLVKYFEITQQEYIGQTN